MSSGMSVCHLSINMSSEQSWPPIHKVTYSILAELQGNINMMIFAFAIILLGMQISGADAGNDNVVNRFFSM